jgi:transposase
MSKQRNKAVSLPVIEPNAAGIDVSATEIFVAMPADRDLEPIRCFPTFTVDLERLADWLQQCHIRTAVMESTGVYWIPLFQILERHKIDARLVNAHHVKNVPGRKTDVSDSQWIQHLHSVGLLRGSFRPDEICAIRSLWRHLDSLIQLATLHLQHMQKALDQMNLRIHHVISDLDGTTGRAIMDAILAGERDPHKLAQLRHPHARARGCASIHVPLQEHQFQAALPLWLRTELLRLQDRQLAIEQNQHGHWRNNGSFCRRDQY